MTTKVPAVSSAIRVIERIAAETPRAISAGALARELNLNRSTCYNILATLEESSWVENNGPRAGWTLGPALSSLRTLREAPFKAILQEGLDELCRQLGYVVFAGQEDGTGGYTVFVVGDPGRGIRVTVDVGDRFPFSTPALMLAFWAYRPWREFARTAQSHPIERFTEFTTIDIDEVAKTFETVRNRGYGHSIQQWNTAQSAVSATVFGPDTRPRFALVALAFSSDLGWDNLDELGVSMRQAAARITKRIGGAPPGADR